MITSDGKFDWAIWRPGPDEKSGYPGQRSSIAEGVVYHSAEGNEASLMAVLDGPRMASWTASNLKDGRFLQHYAVERIVWTNGSKDANIKFRGIESEGVAGEPLTQPQIDNLIRCAEDMAAYFGWQGFRRNIEAWEHSQMTQFGATATACPSGRIPWQTIQEGFMNEEQIRAIVRDELTKYTYAAYDGTTAKSGKRKLTDWAWTALQGQQHSTQPHANDGAHTHPHTHPEAG